jgi:hypothetical protein
MDEDYRTKLIAISAASRALLYKERNPKATFEEIMQKITDDAGDIVKKVDVEEE